jgi:hypothetical protein
MSSRVDMPPSPTPTRSMLTTYHRTAVAITTSISPTNSRGDLGETVTLDSKWLATFAEQMKARSKSSKCSVDSSENNESRNYDRMWWSYIAIPASRTRQLGEWVGPPRSHSLAIEIVVKTPKIPPTEVGGLFRSNLREADRRPLLGIPPTEVGGWFKSDLLVHIEGPLNWL